MHDLLQSKRFKSSWALLSHKELRDADRAAAINGVMRLLATTNVDLDHLLNAAVKGSKPESTTATTEPKPTVETGTETRARKSDLDIEVNATPKRPNPDYRRAEEAYSTVKHACDGEMPTPMSGIARIDGEKSNPRAAYGVITLVVDNDEFGPMMVYGGDLDTARDSMNRSIRVQGMLKPASNPSHLPTLTEVRMMA